MQNLMFETHGDTKFWHVFCRKLPKAAKFFRVSLLADISGLNCEGKYESKTSCFWQINGDVTRKLPQTSHVVT